jgi:outer membrane protein assembly factor BamB
MQGCAGARVWCTTRFNWPLLFRGSQLLLAAAILCLCSGVQAAAQEWTRFRGPNGSGVSQAKTIPTTWTDKDINWKTTLPGPGHSSPALWGDNIFLTAGDDKGERFFVLCLSATTGRVLWQQDFPAKRFPKHNYNTFASSSPATDADRVYISWNTPESGLLLAFDHDGKLAWKKDLGPYKSQHGGGSSPIVYQDMVILANEQDGDSCLVAVESATGKTRWQTPRKTVETAYSTPCVYSPEGGNPSLIFNSEAHGISAIDPATGAVLWEYPKAFDKRSVSSPVVAGNLILGSCGSGGGGNFVVAVRPGDKGANRPPEVAYTLKRSASYVPTSVFVDGRLFVWSDSGIVSCLDAETGAVKWQERAGGNFFSSPVWVDGRLFCVSTRGEVVVVAAGDRFEVLARNQLGEQTHSTPAVAGGRMYIHTVKHLVSVGGANVAP